MWQTGIYPELPLSSEEPQVMHIDLNSCFASVEQQARPRLRGKPVAVTNRLTLGACVVAASYEAKAYGVKVGMRFDEARQLAKDLIMVETDPPKYHHVYKKLVRIMQSYSPNVTMKSIDEGIIDFRGTRENINQRPLQDIGFEIKKRLRTEVGRWMRCNVGIAPNRFLAKTAAGLHKPDGLDTITSKNLRRTFKALKLTDLTGIAKHNEARLNAIGIYTPLEFLETDAETLRRLVFKSICGIDWYRRLRGYEVDDVMWDIKTVGRQYVLDRRNLSHQEILKRLHYLCETTGVKLRHKGKEATGIYVYARTNDGEKWYARQKYRSPFFLNEDIYRRAVRLFNEAPSRHGVPVREIGISCYGITDSNENQLSMFDELIKDRWVSAAVDDVNRRYGEFTMHCADTLGVKELIKQKIPFGSTRYFELLCNRT